MPANKEINNFLNKNIHEETVDSVLLISAPVNDDADYEMIIEAAIHNAIRPYVKWMNDEGMDHIIEVSWGSSWHDPASYRTGFYVNVVAKPTLNTTPWNNESMMFFKLKFDNTLPILDLSDHIDEVLSKN